MAKETQTRVEFLKSDTSKNSAKHDVEVEQTLGKILAALKAGDQKSLASYVELDRMIKSLKKRGLIDQMGEEKRESFTKLGSMAMAKGLMQMQEMLELDKVRVVNIQVENDKHLVVYTKLWSRYLQSYCCMRWWLVKNENGEWKAYDYEDLDSNLRASSLLGLLLRDMGKKDAPWGQEFGALCVHLSRYRMSEDEGVDIDVIHKSVDKLLKMELPREVEMFARYFKMTTYYELGEYELAKGELDKMLVLDADIVGLVFMQGEIAYGLEKYGEAIKHYEKYASIMGWDSDIHEAMSDTYQEMGEDLKAEKHAKLGLKDNPDALGCVASLAIVLPEDRRKELLPHIEASSRPEEAFEVTIDYLLAMEEYDYAQWLIHSVQDEMHAHKELLTEYQDVLDDLQSDEE
ncbi:hypothetical protein [Rubritalea halochordaticola]|uniref:tetratricopeptide repeat protein n=1 Tax=Rubritalea halochordaticola TaxID=714537 RepID=UPI0031FBB795